MSFWDSSYRCFTFNQEDMVPMIEEYISLLRIGVPNPNKVFRKKTKGVGFVKRMSQIIGLDMAAIGQMKTMKGKSECLPWEFLKKFFAKCKNEERIFKVFTIVVYEMVIFLKVLNHVEADIVDLVEQVDNQANLIPAIMAETIHSLNFCQKKGEGQFIRCV